MSEDRHSADAAQAVAWLDEANVLHDDAPEAALGLLRRIPPAALPRERRNLFAYLTNHVTGERLGRWEESLAAQQALIDCAGDDIDLTLWRHAAVAAQLAGDDARCDRWQATLARAAGASPGEARILVALAAASVTVSGQNAVHAGREALRVLQPLATAPLTASLDASFAAVANNLASHLVERPLDDLRHPDLRSALDLAAHVALRCWTRAGGWVQKERAHYLCALTANALGEGERGLAQAHQGLALIDAHDRDETQTIDRAFLELEQGQALWLIGRDGAAQAEERARALASHFHDDGVRRAFADRLRRNEALRDHQLKRITG